MTAGGWLSRFFATRAECAQLVADLQEVIRDRDRWADFAVQLTEANRTQRENLAFVMARADELREALREVAPGHRALGEEELDG